MRALPIRHRLTLWYAAMFASAAALLCLTSLWMLHRSLDQTAYHDLQERADDVREQLLQDAPTRSLRQLQDDFATAYDMKDAGKYLQVRDEQGNWIYRSRRMMEQNPDLPAPGRLPERGQTARFEQGIHQVETLSYPVVVQGRRYSVQTGMTLDKSLTLAASFRSKLLLLMPLTLLLAAAGGHAMSRKALRPVTALTTEARRISDRNLDVRLPVSSARDEISELAGTLNQMLERIGRAFASVRAFTGDASHELRTPITLLRTEIEVALYRPRSAEEYCVILRRLHEETLRMSNLIENLLSLARADGGAEAIALAPVGLHGLLRPVAAAWKSTMNQAMLNFKVEIPEEDGIVLGDAHSIQRLLYLLLENAAKYTPPGGSITLSAVAKAGRVVFSVRDTGNGIAPEHTLRIFDRFYRVPSSGSRATAGSGLGLSLAKWIADRHGTELKVESQPGDGSCFSFSLESCASIRYGNEAQIVAR